MSDLDKISSVFNAKINTVKTKEELQNIKTEFFGKSGQITSQFKTLGSLEQDKRKEFASLNFMKTSTFFFNSLIKIVHYNRKYRLNKAKNKPIILMPFSFSLKKAVANHGVPKTK